MVGEPKPLFPTRSYPKPQECPSPAYAAGFKPIAAPPTTPQAPMPVFADKAAKAPEVLALADRMLDGTEPEQKRIIKRLLVGLAAVPEHDAQSLMEFGREAQTRVGAISEGLLGVARSSCSALMGHLAAIREQIVAIKGADLLDAGIAASLLRRVLPPEERLTAALHEVSVRSDGAAREMPSLAERHRRIEALAARESEARADLDNHIQAARIALQHMKERGIGTPHVSVLEDQLGSMRMTAMVGATDAAQIEAMRSQAARLASAARHITTDLIGLWRRQCAAALALLEAKRTDSLEGRQQAARNLESVRTRLMAAIDGALTSTH